MPKSYSNASKISVSRILSQMHNGEDLPIAYASRILSQKIHNVSASDRVSIIFALKYFKVFIAHTKFIVRIDNQALTWLFQVKNPSTTLLKWKFKLAGYDFEIRHIKGKNNHVADCLSRYIQKPTDSNVLVIRTLILFMSLTKKKQRIILRNYHINK